MRIFALANFEGAIVSLALAVLVAMAPAPPAYADAKQEVALEYFKEGQELYKAGDFYGAQDPFELSLRLDDSNPAAHYWYGKTLMQLGKSEAGIEHLRKARDLGPDTKAGIRAAVELEKMGVETASLTPQPTLSSTFDERQISESDQVKSIIKYFFNENNVMKKISNFSERGMRRKVEMETIYELKINNISQNIITVNVKYRWKYPDGVYSKDDRGIATIEKLGQSLRVIEFETGGQTYISRTDSAELAAQQAAAEVETALLAPPEEENIAVDEDEFAADENVKRMIRQYYDNLGIRKVVSDGPSGKNSLEVRMISVGEVKIQNVVGNKIRANVKFRWEEPDSQYGRNDRGIATLEKIGASYRVIKFETDGSAN